jgi:hypothetical protein
MARKKSIILYNTFTEGGVLHMTCKKCNNYIPVSEDTTGVTCGTCNAKKIPWPKSLTQKVSTGRPAGWHWMTEFVDKDGTVYHKGVEQPKLKGTLKPTKVKTRKIKPKKKKVSENAKLVKVYKEKQKLKRAIKKQKDFLDGKVKK